MNRVAEFDFLDWFGRIKLVDCIYDFILLNPQIGQVIIFLTSERYFLFFFFWISEGFLLVVI